MEKKLTQKTRFSDQELKLLKSTFFEGYGLLKAFRNFMLQIESEDEEIAIRKVISNELVVILKKFFLPALFPDCPLGLQMTSWGGVAVGNAGSKTEEMFPHIMAKEIQIKYTEQQFNVLLNKANKKKDHLMLKDLVEFKDSNKVDMHIELMAYHNIIDLIDKNCMQVYISVNQETDETPEQTAKRMLANSSK